MTTATRRTDVEIADEINALQNLKDRIPQRTAFGDNNRAALEAQIDVLENCMTDAQVDDKYDVEGGYTLGAAFDARDWLWNEADHLVPENYGNKALPPSEGWANLVAGLAAYEAA